MLLTFLVSLLALHQDNFPDVPANHWAYEAHESVNPRAAGIAKFALDALRTTPQARIEDAYKWIYQATLGAEHAIHSTEEARGWLDREWVSLGKPRAAEPMTVPLRPDGALIRVNLRPYRAAGGTEEAILRAFVHGAQAYKAQKGFFLPAWDSFGAALRRKHSLRISEDDWMAYTKKMSACGFPYADHSAAYMKAYAPSYRVLRGTDWQKIDPRRKLP